MIFGDPMGIEFGKMRRPGGRTRPVFFAGQERHSVLMGFLSNGPGRPGPGISSGRTIRGVLWDVVVLMLLALGLSELPAAAAKPTVVGVEVDNPPLEFVGENGRIEGYDVELIKALAAEMKMEVEFKTGPWVELRKQLLSGEVDVLAGMYYSEARDKEVDFSVPHTVLTYSVFVRMQDQDIPSLKDLVGKQVLVGRREIMEEYLKDTGLPIILEPVESASVALGFLASGRADAAAAPLLYGHYLATRYHLTNIRPTGEPINSYDLCFSVREGNRALLARLNEGLNLLKSNGTYRKIYLKWYGILEPEPGVPWSRVIRYAAAVIIPLLIVLGLSGIWTWSLKSQVRRKTNDLSRELEQRRKAESDLQYRLAGEDLATRISTRFVRGRLEEYGKLIDESIADLSQWIKADVGRLFIVGDPHRLVECARWIAPGIQWESKLPKEFPLSDFPWVHEHLCRGELLVLKGIDSISGEAEPERQLWLVSGVRSMIAVPLLRGDVLIGCLELVSLNETMAVGDEDRWLLRLGTEVLANARELQAAAQGLMMEKERLGVTLRSIGEGVVATNIENRVVLLNTAAEKITGWTQEHAQGLPLAEVFPIEADLLQPTATGGKSGRGGDSPPAGRDLRFIQRGGGERVVEYSASHITDPRGQVIGLVIVLRDVTMRRRMESDLQRTAKLEALGVLAGGIAHDFNNILTGILGSISFARLQLESGEKIDPVLEEAEKASLRAAGLTQQLLTLSKGGAPIKVAASIAEIINDSVKFALRGSNSICEMDLPADLWPATVDAVQFSQVIQNLVINGAQAMPDGGRILIRARNMEYDGRGEFPVHPGRYIKLDVIDEGQGIPPELLNRIFDPFFTTKAKGSGLGLTTAHSIMIRHGGSLGVTSQVGRGTTFTILVPASFEFAPDQASKAEAPAFRRGRVLLMDDEELVRVVGRGLFGKFGYEVDTVPDGAEAIQLYRKANAAGRPYDIVILDLTVPGGMGGEECLKRLLGLDPTIVAVVSSGYSNDPVMAEFQRFGFKGILQKPYRVEDIQQLLSKLEIRDQTD